MKTTVDIYTLHELMLMLYPRMHTHTILFKWAEIHPNNFLLKNFQIYLYRSSFHSLPLQQFLLQAVSFKVLHKYIILVLRSVFCP